MKKLTYVMVILAAASTAAMAGDLKQDKNAPAPTVAATQMNDAEMDKVTAGQGFGVQTAGEHTGNVSHSGFGLDTAGGNARSPGPPGLGLCTAGRAVCAF
jgi:hypothetical protein